MSHQGLRDNFQTQSSVSLSSLMHLVHVQITKKIISESLMAHSSLTKMLILLLYCYWKLWCNPSNSENAALNLIPTPVENSDAWNIQKDKTGILPDVTTNAHQKCCVHDLPLNNIDCMMRSTPLQFSFMPPGWCFITDLEILKKTRRPNTEQMKLIQLIQLMHLEYQINNKNVG